MRSLNSTFVFVATAAVSLCIIAYVSLGSQNSLSLSAVRNPIRPTMPCFRSSRSGQILSRLPSLRATVEGSVAGESTADEEEMPPGFWEYALRDSDLARGQRRILQVATPFSPQGGKKIIIARVGKDANVYAFDYMCPHLGVSLADGKFGVTKDGCTIQCSQHNSIFNIENGKCEDWLPGGGFNVLQRMVTPAVNLVTYPTLIRDGNVFVDMSQAKTRGNFEDWVEDRPKMKK